MKLFSKYSFIIGLILLFFILLRIDLDLVLSQIKKTDLKLLFLAVLLIPIMFLAKALCWNYLKSVLGIKYKLLDSYLMFSAGIAVGTFTPGRAGEIIKAFYLKKNGHSLGKALLTVVLDRLSDFIVLALLAYFGLIALFGHFYKFTLYFGLVLFALLVLILFFRKQTIKNITKKALYFILPQKHAHSFKLNFNDFSSGLRKYKPKDWLIVFSITVLSWFIYYLQMFILAKSLNIENISFFYVSVIVTITGLATLLPVSILGLGTREAVLIFFFALFSVSKELAVSFSMLVLLMSLLGDAFGCLGLLLKPIRRRK